MIQIFKVDQYIKLE